jgi:hypothetical protein
MSGEQQGVSEEDFEAARELLSEKFFTSVERFTCHCVLRVEPLNESIDFAKKKFRVVLPESSELDVRMADARL